MAGVRASKTVISCLLSALFSVTALGQAQDGETEKKIVEAGFVEVDGRRVEHTWQANVAEVFGADGSGRWRHFMHGLTDEGGVPFAWEPLLSMEQELWLSGERVRGDVKNSDLYSLRVAGGTDFTLPRPALSLSELGGRGGSVLRLYIWIRGEGTGEGGPLWESAPQVSLILRDGMGVEQLRVDSMFRTRGTFPWFCYHVDMRIPSDFSALGDTGVAGGVFIRLANPTSGSAWFCTPSWEFLVGEAAEAATGQLPLSFADPKRGTFAPNPDYDEMPLNFVYGLPNGDSIKWRFIDGNLQARSLVLSYDLAAYIESVKNDWFHMTQSVPYLLYLRTVGVPLKRIPELQPGWAERLAAALSGLQNAKSGMWQLNGRDNLLLTYLLVSQCFTPEYPRRPNEPAYPSEWCAVAKYPLKRADLLAQSVLSAQLKTPEGVLAGWNKYALQGQDLQEGSRDACLFDMRYTSMAVQLLTRCLPEVGERLAERIRASIKAAYQYGVANVLSNTWIWGANEAQDELFMSPLSFSFLQGTQALDVKFNQGSVKAPVVEMTFKGDAKCELTAKELGENVVSLRVYELHPGKGVAACTDNDLLAIVPVSRPTPSACDPLVLAKRFADAQSRDGISRPIGVREAGTFYLERKLANVKNARFAVLDKDKKASFVLPMRVRGREIAIVASDNYGNLSTGNVIAVPAK